MLVGWVFVLAVLGPGITLNSLLLNTTLPFPLSVFTILGQMGVLAFLGLEGTRYQSLSLGAKGKDEKGKREMHCATQNQGLEVSPVESHLAQEQSLEQI